VVCTDENRKLQTLEIHSWQDILILCTKLYYCTILYCTILHYTELYCNIVCFMVLSHNHNTTNGVHVWMYRILLHDRIQCYLESNIFSNILCPEKLMLILKIALWFALSDVIYNWKILLRQTGIEPNNFCMWTSSSATVLLYYKPKLMCITKDVFSTGKKFTALSLHTHKF
jgi:hypothetical protein